MSNKDFVYIPALSSGMYNLCMKTNETIEGSTYTYRYFSDNEKEFPQKYKYPYHLISAGHHYKKMDALQNMGMDPKKMFVIGDSGGYQIASGAIKYEQKIVKQIFEWLEKNSSHAMNLDIPPRMKMEGKIQECIDISKQNYKYFSDNQTGQTKFYNVIQGFDYHSYTGWYNAVKEFNFNGWALGGAVTIERVIASMCVLMENGEFKKDNINYVHLLGTNRIIDFIIIQTFQKVFNELGYNVLFTCDSSSPSRISAFGSIYTGYSLKSMSYQNVNFSNKNTYDSNATFPLFNQFDRDMLSQLKLNIFDKWEGKSYYPMVLHNLYTVLDARETVISLLNTDPDIQKQIFSDKVYKMTQAIYKICTSSTPFKEFEKRKELFNIIEIQLGGSDIQSEVKKETFFEF